MTWTVSARSRSVPNSRYRAMLERDEDLLVYVDERTGRPFSGEHADHLEACARNLNLLADDCGLIGAQQVGHRCADHRVPLPGCIVPGGEHPAVLDRGVLHRGVVGGRPDDRQIGVPTAELDLDLLLELGHHRREEPAVALERLRVIEGEAHAVGAGHASLKALTRKDPKQVGAERADAGLHGLLRPAPERHHRDQSRHTNDDAERGEAGPKRVRTDRLQRGRDGFAGKQHAIAAAESRRPSRPLPCPCRPRPAAARREGRLRSC